MLNPYIHMLICFNNFTENNGYWSIVCIISLFVIILFRSFCFKIWSTLHIFLFKIFLCIRKHKLDSNPSGFVLESFSVNLGATFGHYCSIIVDYLNDVRNITRSFLLYISENCWHVLIHDHI